MPPKLKDLQKQCKDIGLDHTGKVSELVQRLKDHRNRGTSSPEDQEDPTCDAILVTQSMTGSVDDMKRYAHDAFEQTLEVEELDVREVMGELYVGNVRGLGLAGLPERVRILEENDTAKNAKIAELDANIAELNDYVSILRLAGPDYKRVRNRALTVFKRDKLRETLMQSDRDIIEAGNVTAHSGDAAIDALLYDGVGAREDSYVFEALYGLHPTDVMKIIPALRLTSPAHKETIEILNLHAGVKAHKYKTGTDEFYRRFAIFIQAFKRSDPRVNYLNEGFMNATCAAYWSLRECEKYEECKLSNIYQVQPAQDPAHKIYWGLQISAPRYVASLLRLIRSASDSSIRSSSALVLGSTLSNDPKALASTTSDPQVPLIRSLLSSLAIEKDAGAKARILYALNKAIKSPLNRSEFLIGGGMRTLQGLFAQGNAKFLIKAATLVEDNFLNDDMRAESELKAEAGVMKQDNIPNRYRPDSVLNDERNFYRPFEDALLNQSNQEDLESDEFKSKVFSALSALKHKYPGDEACTPSAHFLTWLEGQVDLKGETLFELEEEGGQLTRLLAVENHSLFAGPEGSESSTA
ncbi:hypothetical protein C7212DRAFT_361502 [Tuber magnatum]|uniref:Nucleotide exchange factor SIL1 n=1 Tax=Tuber magnatum TaxID=42249 RepID=A0A317T038_9PEZI|nr:hypothetical protein C7212DRAFT_361502 [Tuber magnatum]